MKNILLILLIAIFGVIQNASAQAPENVNYQAIARDTAGNPLANQALTVKLSILKGTALGPITWQETHSVTSNSFGQYRIRLGAGTSTGLGSSLSFSVINWGTSSYFLRTEINPGTGFINMGTDPLSSVPYALFSKSTSALPNGTVNGQVLSWNGTSWVPASICSLLTQYYRDADGDGFGNAAVSAASCFQPSGYVLNSSDCNDNNSSINPSIAEICNTIDDNCDGLVDNGAPTLNDINNCGTCFNVCPVRPNSTVTCVAGLCSFICTSGFANCNSIATDGCEISLLSNPNNCGTCGNVCASVANSTTICSGGVCSIICNAGFGNCDGNNINGCETSITTTTNCGSCGIVCPARANATTTCSGGICSYTCNTGFADCNANSADGCEISLLSNTSNCGACGNVCTVVANASSVCVSGVCTLICNSGFANCNGSFADGCEVVLSSNSSNCNACGTVCPTRSNATTTCTAGVCSFTCLTGFSNCDGNNANGCETSITTITNCGGCGTVCPTRANATTTCSGGICSFNCNSGFADCNGTSSDGCEIALLTNINNCGACGNSCPTVANATSTCVAGVCSFTCNSGFANCNGSNADGCEINLLSNTNNCGACGSVCPTRTNATSVCVSGACSIVCNSGFGNCDGNNTNGCEISLLTDKNNCGTCGHICPGAQVCTAGVCN